MPKKYIYKFQSPVQLDEGGVIFLTF